MLHLFISCPRVGTIPDFDSQITIKDVMRHFARQATYEIIDGTGDRGLPIIIRPVAFTGSPETDGDGFLSGTCMHLAQTIATEMQAAFENRAVGLLNIEIARTKFVQKDAESGKSAAAA